MLYQICIWKIDLHFKLFFTFLGQFLSMYSPAGGTNIIMCDSAMASLDASLSQGHFFGRTGPWKPGPTHSRRQHSEKTHRNKPVSAGHCIILFILLLISYSGWQTAFRYTTTTFSNEYGSEWSLYQHTSICSSARSNLFQKYNYRSIPHMPSTLVYSVLAAFDT